MNASIALKTDSSRVTYRQRLYIIILNWNGWKDTIECLESTLRLSSPNVCVVVCDNSSTDGSWHRIKSWAEGDTPAESTNPDLERLTVPPLHKPVRYLELSREQAESGNITEGYPLFLIQTGANLGFAGGNNIGLRFALNDPACHFIWVLNNDTVVEANALTALLDSIQENPQIGICGSLTLSYYHPCQVQAQGGKTYHRWTGRVQGPRSLVAGGLKDPPTRLDYINGASMLVRREFLETVGLMDESYFLYFEELDWAARAKGLFELGYSANSVVYHKEGAALGTSSDRSRRSVLADRYLSRNRVLYTKRFVPWALPSVLASVMFAAIYRLIRGDHRRAIVMLSAMLQGLLTPRSRNML